VNDGGPDWQSKARRLAATVLIVAVALCVAVNVLRQYLAFLIISVTVIATVALVLAVVRGRRNWW
jgi:hypothetical protein